MSNALSVSESSFPEEFFFGDVLVLPHDNDDLAVIRRRVERGCGILCFCVETAFRKDRELLAPALGRWLRRFLGMLGHRKKGGRLPALSEDRVVPWRILAEVLGRERLRTQFPDLAKLGAVFLFPVARDDDARGLGLRRLGAEHAGKNDQSDRQ